MKSLRRIIVLLVLTIAASICYAQNSSDMNRMWAEQQCGGAAAYNENATNFKSCVDGKLSQKTTTQTPGSDVGAYLYTISITGDDKEDPDAVSARVAKSLKEYGYGGSCVDLRMLGSGDGMTLGIVMTNPVKPVDLDNVRKDVCDKVGPAAYTNTIAKQGPCSVKFNRKDYKMADLKLTAYPFGLPDAWLRSNPPKSIVSRPLQPGSKLPRFSDACNTGSYQDSWNNAASTPEAKQFISNLGINLTTIRTISLETSSGTNVFDFGFPDHRQPSAQDQGTATSGKTQ